MIFDTGIEENLIRATMNVQYGLLDEILKLPTYASYKFGDFEYQFKVGTPVGKKREIYYSTHTNAYYISEYSRYDNTYAVICEKNEPVIAYEDYEWNIGSEYYDYKGKLTRTEVYSGNTIVENKMDSENWWLTFERKKTDQYDDGREPQEYISNSRYAVVTKPFYNYRTVYTTLTEAGYKDFSLRLYTALKSLS